MTRQEMNDFQIDGSTLAELLEFARHIQKAYHSQRSLFMNAMKARDEMHKLLREKDRELEEFKKINHDEELHDLGEELHEMTCRASGYVEDMFYLEQELEKYAGKKYV